MGIFACRRSGARSAGVEPSRPRCRINVWGYPALFAGLAVVVIFVGVWRADLTQDTWLDELWLEVVKAGVQVIAIGVLGGALATIWRAINDDRQAKIACAARKRDQAIEQAARNRDQAIERNDKIRAELVSLVALYNGVKCVRRNIRSLGLDLKAYPEAERETVRRTAVLSKEQADGFHAQMLILNGLQLDFESKAKQFGQTNLLGVDTERVVTELGYIENHLNRVLGLWEGGGWTIREGVPLWLVSEGLESLLRAGGYFRPRVSEPLGRITKLINKHVFGEALTGTQNALNRIESEHRRRDAEI